MVLWCATHLNTSSSACKTQEKRHADRQKASSHQIFLHFPLVGLSDYLWFSIKPFSNSVQENINYVKSCTEWLHSNETSFMYFVYNCDFASLITFGPAKRVPCFPMITNRGWRYKVRHLCILFIVLEQLCN